MTERETARILTATEIKKCWECKHVGYQWSEERQKDKRKLKCFFNYDIDGNQEIVYYCQNREACVRDKQKLNLNRN
jgi:hypothetical protein